MFFLPTLHSCDAGLSHPKRLALFCFSRERKLSAWPPSGMTFSVVFHSSSVEQTTGRCCRICLGLSQLVSVTWHRYFFFIDCPTYFPLFSIAHGYRKDALLKAVRGACNLRVTALVYTLRWLFKNKVSEEQGVTVDHITESYLSLAILKLVISFIRLWLQTSAWGSSIWNASLISYTVLPQMLISPICSRLDFWKDWSA